MYTRTRQKGFKKPLPVNTGGFHSYGNGTITKFSGVNPNGWADGPYVVTLDREIPGFRAKSAAGFVFMNPFESTSEIRVFQDAIASYSRAEPAYPGESTSFYKKTTQNHALCAFGTALSPVQPLDPFGPDIPGISARIEQHAASRDVAWNEALADMAKTNALLLVTAAEIGKTAHLVRELALLLKGRLGALEYLSTIRPGGKWTPQAITQAVMSEWLKIRYGVMPTIYEIQGVVDALNKPVKPPRLTARGKDSWTDSYTRTRSVASSGSRPAVNMVTVTTIEAKIRAGILYAPVLEDTLVNRLGLHPSAIPETLFELTRLSFVADWFVDLSTSLRALNAPLYGKSLGGWITETYVATTEHTVAGVGSSTVNITVNGATKPTTWSWSDDPSSAKASAFYTYKKRTPMEGLAVRTPSVRVRMSLARAADALSLCGTILGQASRSANRGIRL